MADYYVIYQGTTYEVADYAAGIAKAKELGPDAVFPDERAEATKEGSRPSRSSSSEEEPAAPGILTRPPPRSSRMVSGPLREAPVMATVFVDVYFVGAAPSDAGNETQGRY